MASKLPDSFLKDLDDLSDDEQIPSGSLARNVESNEREEEKEQIKEISKLKHDENFKLHLDMIAQDLNTIYPADKFINLEKSDPIYDIIKKSNQYLMEIEDEINILHKEIRDIYLNKFSELESIVYDPIEYTTVFSRIFCIMNIKF